MKVNIRTPVPAGRGGRRDNAGMGADGGLERLELEVAGVRHGYWLARGPRPGGALLIMLHGSGMTGGSPTAFTGLAAGVRPPG